MHYFLVPRVKIENASAVSSTYTIGIPPMTAWLGMMYAMQRKLREMGLPEISFKSMGVCYHKVKVKRFKPEKGYKYSIIGSRNPLVTQNALPRSFLEVPTLNMTVDLLFRIDSLDPDDMDESLYEKITDVIYSLRACGGNIISFRDITRKSFITKDDSNFKRIMMPGYTVIERRDLLINGEEPDDIDRFLNALATYANAKRDENGNFEKWEYSRKQKGWIIPIGVGYKGITLLGTAENQKDKNYPHRFVEGITTLGECKMPISLNSISDMLWHFEYNEEESLYLCKNQEL